MNWNWKDNIKDKDIKYVKELCNKWEKNKLKNPITNSKIQENKITYNIIKKQCNLKIIKDYDKKSSSSSHKKTKIKKSTSDLETKSDEYFPNNNDKDFISKLHNLQEMTVHTTSKIKDLKTIEDFKKQVFIECPTK